MSSLKELFKQQTGANLETLEQLAVSGSNRKYFRLKNETVSLIGVEGVSVEENRAFLYMARHFRANGIPVPKVYISSTNELQYLQEDLGDTLLFDYIKKGRLTGVFSTEEKEMLHRTMELLPKIQLKGIEDFDFGQCYPQEEFNHRSVMWDLNYFKYCFLKATGLEFQENLLEDNFEKMARILLKDQTHTFMYRDFQSRNVMIKDGNPYFIDFQGGRKGPVYYDVASFLWQARAQYGDNLRNDLLDTYVNSLKQYLPIDEKEFKKNLNHFVLFRLLQVLGAYGFRGYFEKKPHFLQSIPYALDVLKDLMSNTDFSEYPYLISVLKEMSVLKQFADINLHKPLVVKVYSFSYKKGVPNDDSGNGGGFIFDCRAINNPGKYERYASLTGLDQPVIEFLEKDGEILRLLDLSFQMTDASIKRYIDRRFTHLMISFGCTGGQHRSVYSAQKMAEHIHSKFGLEVQLIHREQNIETEFRATKKTIKSKKN